MKTYLKRLVFPILTLSLMLFLSACGGDSNDSPAPADTSESENGAISVTTTDAAEPATAAEPAAAANSAADASDTATTGSGRVVLGFGDSNTSGVGVAQPWPDKLELLLGDEVFRRGRNGDNTNEGVGRLAGLLAELNPTHVCIMEGTNDAIQGIPAAQTLNNIAAMIDMARNSGAVVILGTLPPMIPGGNPFVTPEAITLRLDLDRQLAAVAVGSGARVARVSEAIGDGVGLMQADGIHPNDAGHSIMAREFFNQF